MNIPDGWAWTTLGEVNSPERNFDTPVPDDDRPYLGMDAVEPNSARITGLVRAGQFSSASQIVKPGYTLYGRLRPYLNKVVEADFEGLCSAEFIAFPPRDWLAPRFLMYRMLAPDFVEFSTSINQGDRPRVNASQIAQFQFALPPVDEQQRIVTAMDYYLSGLDHALGGLRRVADLLVSWRYATLSWAFRGLLSNDDFSEGNALDIPIQSSGNPIEAPWTLPDGWAWRRIGELFKVSVGATPSRSDPTLWDGDIPWVSSGEVAFNRIIQTRESINIRALADPHSRIHPPGTVMLAMIGEGKTRGQAAILDIAAAHNQNCASIRVSETSVIPEYVYWFLYLRYAENRREASGGNQPALNKAKVENIAIPLAPLGTQRKLVAILEGMGESVSQLQNGIDEMMNHARVLRDSIFATAFSGRLTLDENALTEGSVQP